MKVFIKMSVNKSDRTDKSELCYLAEQAEYKIIKMTMNEKYFPKRARFIITKMCEKPTPLGVGWIAHLFYSLMCM